LTRVTNIGLYKNKKGHSIMIRGKHAVKSPEQLKKVLRKKCTSRGKKGGVRLGEEKKKIWGLSRCNRAVGRIKRWENNGCIVLSSAWTNMPP